MSNTMATAEELIAILHSPEGVDAAVGELTALGEKALSPLAEAVRDPNNSPKARALCAELIGQIVPDGVEWLLKKLSTSRGEAADFAAWGLRFNIAPERIEPALFELASCPTAEVRLNAARALQFIHVDLKSWNPVVLRLTRDPEERVRVAAFRLLVELAAADVLLERVPRDELMSVLESAAQDLSEEVRNLGAELGRFRESAT